MRVAFVVLFFCAALVMFGNDVVPALFLFQVSHCPQHAPSCLRPELWWIPVWLGEWHFSETPASLKMEWRNHTLICFSQTQQRKNFIYACVLVGTCTLRLQKLLIADCWLRAQTPHYLFCYFHSPRRLLIRSTLKGCGRIPSQGGKRTFNQEVHQVSTNVTKKGIYQVAVGPKPGSPPCGPKRPFI